MAPLAPSHRWAVRAEVLASTALATASQRAASAAQRAAGMSCAVGDRDRTVETCGMEWQARAWLMMLRPPAPARAPAGTRVPASPRPRASGGAGPGVGGGGRPRGCLQACSGAAGPGLRPTRCRGRAAREHGEGRSEMRDGHGSEGIRCVEWAERTDNAASHQRCIQIGPHDSEGGRRRVDGLSGARCCRLWFTVPWCIRGTRRIGVRGPPNCANCRLVFRDVRGRRQYVGMASRSVQKWRPGRRHDFAGNSPDARNETSVS